MSPDKLNFDVFSEVVFLVRMLHQASLWISERWLYWRFWTTSILIKVGPSTEKELVLKRAAWRGYSTGGFGDEQILTMKALLRFWLHPVLLWWLRNECVVVHPQELYLLIPQGLHSGLIVSCSLSKWALWQALGQQEGAGVPGCVPDLPSPPWLLFALISPTAPHPLLPGHIYHLRSARPKRRGEGIQSFGHLGYSRHWQWD